MQPIPNGVLLLYKHHSQPYEARTYSTTAREFQADPMLNPEPSVFQPETPLLDRQFQVDKACK